MSTNITLRVGGSPLTNAQIDQNFTNLKSQADSPIWDSSVRLKGDFSNATLASRTMFQTSTTNGATVVGARPDGSGTVCGFRAYSKNDVDNAAYADIIATDGDSVKLRSNINGSGTAVPLVVEMNGTETLRFLQGGGLKFPAAQLASSDANALDDYEEGTFTPSFGGTTSDPTVTSYTARSGYYVKVGRLVFFAINISINVLGSAGSGNLTLKGLPFAATDTWSPAAVGIATGFVNQPNAFLVAAGGSFGYVYKSLGTNSPTSDLASGCNFWCSGLYFVAT